jgi:hypothetical protein
MELQHINVKLPVENPGEVDLELLIPVFHKWIQDQVCEELLLDVADYRHVEAGPGVVLIGHQANYSVDNADGRLGIRYNRKAELGGSNQDRLRQATRAALTACQRLESEPSLNGQLRFNRRELELFINDRLLAPNLQTTHGAADPDLRTFFQDLFAGSGFSLSNNNGDPRRLFSVSVRTSRPLNISDLLNNLAG